MIFLYCRYSLLYTLFYIRFKTFICRSTSGDTVQFVEQSLDTNLLNNAVRLRIPHCPLLPGGVHIQETLNNILILITTSQTVHRLVLPHPTHMYHSVSSTFVYVTCHSYITLTAYCSARSEICPSTGSGH